MREKKSSTRLRGKNKQGTVEREIFVRVFPRTSAASLMGEKKGVQCLKRGKPPNAIRGGGGSFAASRRRTRYEKEGRKKKKEAEEGRPANPSNDKGGGGLFSPRKTNVTCPPASDRKTTW